MKPTYAPYQFRGGVHPHDCKDATAAVPIRRIALPPRLVVSMAQHLGKPALPVVKVGDTVTAGQCIGNADGPISAPVHAPAAGVVKAVDTAPTPSGRPAPAVTLETQPAESADARETPVFADPITDWRQTPVPTLLERIGAAGVAGMGGAGFPTRVKLSPPPDKPIDTLIFNGAECEPYLTSDHHLMLEQADAVVEGACIIRHLLGNPRMAIAIEDNTPDAVEAMRAALERAGETAELFILRTHYPQGSEKQQIYAITGRNVPAGGLPMEVGVVVDNVGTAVAVRDAVRRGRPLVERVVTVTGPAIREPANLLAPIGTPLADLVAACGGVTETCRKVVVGGPMMGFAQHGLDVGMTKTTSGVLALTAAAAVQFEPMPCINCGRCNAACPLRLLPSELARAIEADDLDEAAALNVLDCFECGCCAYVCPAHRPMVQHMRRAKGSLLARRAQAMAKKH